MDVLAALDHKRENIKIKQIFPSFFISKIV